MELRGFTPPTLEYLIGVSGAIRVYEGLYVLPGAGAIALLRHLLDTHEDHMPCAKWATIQHLEGLMAAAIDDSGA